MRKYFITTILLLSALIAVDACAEKDPFQTEVVAKSSVVLANP